MKRIAAVVLLAGCTTSTRPHVRDPDPEPAIPANETIHPSGDRECKFVDAMVPMDTHAIPIPKGYTEDQMYTAIIQAIAKLGMRTTLAQRDAMTITTDWVTGKTLMTTCGIDALRSYELRYAILGSLVSISVGCRESHAYDGRMTSGLEGCAEPVFTTAGDAEIPRGVIEIAIALMETRDPKPATDP